MRVFFLIVLAGLTSNLHCQKLVNDELDEFTGEKVKETSFEVLHKSMKQTVYVAGRSVDSNKYLVFKIMPLNDFVSKDGKVLLKLVGGNIISGTSIDHYFPCTGCGAKGFAGSGAQGLRAQYRITSSDVDLIRNQLISTIRMYTEGGYIDVNVKEKNAGVIPSILELL